MSKSVERMTSLLKSFQSVENFNDVIGNPNDYESVHNQLLRVEEEVLEAQSAVDWLILGEDQRELLLDGVADVLVTALGLIKKLEAMNYDVLGALEAVCLNNESKYCKNEAHADETIEFYKSQGVETYKQYSESNYVWIVKDKAQNKLRKPIGFQSVELNKFLPKENS